MKPNFALSLSFEGIRLLHRAAGGWRIVGDVGLDAADMAGELAVLRRTATALEPGGLRTKVLLPPEQIKYLTIDTEDMDTDARHEAARTALAGATPYTVEDLAYDISDDGRQTHVAAVARETLAEAEGFAMEHRFHPVSFATIPGENPYLGEPFFGPTQAAADMLAPGQEVEPDGIAVVVIGDLDAAPQEVAETAQMAAEPEAPDEDADDLPEGTEERKDTPDATEVVADAPDDTDADAQTTAGADLAEGTPTEVAEQSTETPEAAVVDDKTPAPDETPAAPVLPSLGPARRAAPAIPPAPKVEAPATGFTSRRRTEPPVSKPAPVVAAPSLPAEPGFEPRVSVASATLPAASEVPPPDSSTLMPHRAAAAAASAAAPIGRFLSRRKSRAAGRADTVIPAGDAAVLPQPRSEAERMTVFGARRDVGGKPRFLGLILTAALLIFLAGVAAWASVFLDDGLNMSRLFGDRAPRQEATAPAPADIETPPEAVVTASLSPTLTEEDTAVLDALRDPVPPESVVLSDDALEASYATTGIWPRAPQVPPEPAGLIDIDDLYVTSIDTVTTASDAVALPAVASFATDAAFGNVTVPAAAGTVFALDASGLVIPTAQGALSPDGYTVYLGRPEVVPPATPARFQAVPADDPATTALAAVRPKLRPGDLSETNERANLDGLTRSELAGLRPRLRPNSVQEQAQAAAAAAAAAAAPAVDTTEAVEAALATPEAPADPFASATALATRASARPDTRPRNFARIVQRAQRTPQPQEETRVATVAPRVVTPKVPSKTSVAKQATVKNALNLRKVNLIGVYGKPSNRRALVRLANGRYKKVVVGDRIDGGKVSAIGDSELRYNKRGRNVVLKMPRS